MFSLTPLNRRQRQLELANSIGEVQRPNSRDVPSRGWRILLEGSLMRVVEGCELTTMLSVEG
jgi:hypothetical protein